MYNLLKKQHKNLSREELIKLAQQDNFQALEELIKREEKNAYAMFLYLNPNKEDVCDLAQEALLRMAKNIKKLKDPKKFGSWFNQIITHLFYDDIRKKYKKPSIISIDELFEDGETPLHTKPLTDRKKSPSESSLAQELNEQIKFAIHSLPEPYRLAIILRELQGLNYDDIAEITKASLGTVKSRIARARNKLQENLKPYLIQ